MQRDGVSVTPPVSRRPTAAAVRSPGLTLPAAPPVRPQVETSPAAVAMESPEATRPAARPQDELQIATPFLQSLLQRWVLESSRPHPSSFCLAGTDLHRQLSQSRKTALIHYPNQRGPLLQRRVHRKVCVCRVLEVLGEMATAGGGVGSPCTLSCAWMLLPRENLWVIGVVDRSAGRAIRQEVLSMPKNCRGTGKKGFPLGLAHVLHSHAGFLTLLT